MKDLIQRTNNNLKSAKGQQLDYLSQIGGTDTATVFVDGTKVEVNAGKYSFVWRKSVEKH